MRFAKSWHNVTILTAIPTQVKGTINYNTSLLITEIRSFPQISPVKMDITRSAYFEEIIVISNPNRNGFQPGIQLIGLVKYPKLIGLL